jgi:hypothetical protein
MTMDTLLALAGLFGGAIFGGLGAWLGRKKAREQRGLDERAAEINLRARSLSWWVTLAGIYVLFVLGITKVETSLAETLGILLILHMGGWTFGTFYYNRKL